MSDIDFDELDREVNKLVGKEALPDMIQADVSVIPKEEFLGTPEESQQSVEQVSSDMPQKPRGRFMDVVHPSSDMSSKDTFSNVAERKSLQPIEATQQGADNKDSFDDVADEQQIDTTDSSTDMPDPLALHEAREAEKASATLLDEPSSDSTIESIDETVTGSKDALEIINNDNAKQDTFQEYKEETSDKDEPINEEKDMSKEETPTSVFIADAQTEKRPLGGVVKEESGENNEEPVPAIEAAIELPPELEKSLVAIEAGESPDDIPEPDMPTKQDDVHEVSEKAEEGEKPKQNSSINGLLASGSIPQQYRQAAEKIAQQDTPAKPLFFDAQHYATTPAIATKKQKSGFMHLLQWIFIVIGLLLLGGTLGAAIFVFVNGQ